MAARFDEIYNSRYRDDRTESPEPSDEGDNMDGNCKVLCRPYQGSCEQGVK